VLSGVLDELVTTGALPARRRPNAEFTVWSCVHGMVPARIVGGPAVGYDDFSLRDPERVLVVSGQVPEIRATSGGPLLDFGSMRAVWGLACVLCTVSGRPVLGLLAVALLVAVLPLRSRGSGRVLVAPS
jgi:hypothetical protein